jgi:hypothetical protein
MRSTLLPSHSPFVYSLLALLLVGGAAFAQKPVPLKPQSAPPKSDAQKIDTPKTDAPKSDAQKSADAQPLWRLSVSKEMPTTMTLRAKNAPLREIAAELSKKLKVLVILSPLMQKQRVTLEFSNIPIEGAVRMLAPLPYVDYEVSGDPNEPQRLMGIYLYAFNEAPPDRNAAAKGSDQAILIEGNTEEGTDEYEKQRAKDDAPLLVKIDKNMVSVRARKQPLTVVLYEIANKVDIPFEMKYESTDLVDVDFTNYTLEQAVRALSPNIRLFQRINLTNYEAMPLRLLLVAPANAATIN